MKFFIDTANLNQIKEAQDLGVLDGVTTNPSLMAKEGITGKENIINHYKTICDIVDGDVSAEVISTEFEGMIKEGEELAALNPQIVVKLPMIRDGIKAAKYFSDKGIKTNVTLVFSAGQALLAAKAGATYVSPFIGRLDDISTDVGLGWSLNAGGKITRVIHGHPDESPRGYLNQMDNIPFPYDESSPTILDDIRHFSSYAGGQPDIFSYSIPGYSGRFILQPNGEVLQLNKTALKINWEEVKGETLTGAYQLKGSNVWDSALTFTADMYKPKTHMCVSFTGPYKHFKLSKGGAILTDDLKAYHWFKRARYSGRRECSYHDDNLDMLGWNFYMMPELAARGLLLMNQFYDNSTGEPKVIEDLELKYPDLSKFKIYTGDE